MYIPRRVGGKERRMDINRCGNETTRSGARGKGKKKETEKRGFDIEGGFVPETLHSSLLQPRRARTELGVVSRLFFCRVCCPLRE